MDGVVCHGVHLEVPPYLFDWVEFWCVWRQQIDAEAFVLAANEVLGSDADVSMQPIPHDDERLWSVAQQILEKLDNDIGVDGTVHTEAEAYAGLAGRPDEECGNSRDLLV